MDPGTRLMERVRTRDVAAFESLYDTYHRLVFGIALRMLADAALAEDLTQAVFLKLWSAPDAFRGGAFTAWLARVTRNRALDVIRARGARPESELPSVDVPLDSDLEDDVMAGIDARRVHDALRRLPSDQRSLIEMGFFAGVTHTEIAERTGTPLGTVKTRIRAGLRKMRTLLGEQRAS